MAADSPEGCRCELCHVPEPSSYQATEMVAAAVADRKEALEEVERLRAALEAVHGLLDDRWGHADAPYEPVALDAITRAREALEGGSDG